MVPHRPHNTTRILKVQVPFLCQLAREFRRDKAHIWRVCTGARLSPLRERILIRQAELIQQRQAEASATNSMQAACKRAAAGEPAETSEGGAVEKPISSR
jgi:hypothetical protein